MRTFFALLALYEGNSPITDELPSRRRVTWSFDVFFDLRLSRRLCKQSIRRDLRWYRADYDVNVMDSEITLSCFLYNLVKFHNSV